MKQTRVVKIPGQKGTRETQLLKLNQLIKQTKEGIEAIKQNMVKTLHRYLQMFEAGKQSHNRISGWELQLIPPVQCLVEIADAPIPEGWEKENATALALIKIQAVVAIELDGESQDEGIKRAIICIDENEKEFYIQDLLIDSLFALTNSIQQNLFREIAREDNVVN